MSKEFCHLHLHTEYSLLDSSAKIKKLIARAKELGMKSITVNWALGERSSPEKRSQLLSLTRFNMMTHSYLDPQDVDSGSAKIVFNTTFHFICKTDACQVKEHRKRSKGGSGPVRNRKTEPLH